MRAVLIALTLTLSALAPHATAQWALQSSGTTASLRGIHAVSAQIAWASGTEGTILRTIDGGVHWQRCTTPPNAAQLDFRGIQAFDANTALAMSSGKGDLSRLYKTTDGCQTWTLVFTNPDADGFWDAIRATAHSGMIVGDPVAGRFAFFSATDLSLTNWVRFGELSDFRHFRFEPIPYNGESLFAASNSVLLGSPEHGVAVATGGPYGSFFAFGLWENGDDKHYPSAYFGKTSIPLAKGETAGAFAVQCSQRSRSVAKQHCVAVGGDYQLPQRPIGTAAFTSDGGTKWIASTTPPHGYRSAVAYDADAKTWITVGPNGTDISTDDGRNWRALKPGANDAPDADQQWNALSLPFVVGPHGRIGVLESAALAVAARSKP